MKKLTAKKGVECMACLECVRACSTAFYKEFDPAKACLQIVDRKGAAKPMLCVQCGKCAEACPNGAITQNGWGQILFSAPAASSDVKISAVFYSTPEDEAAALGLAKELGGVSTFQSSDYDEYGARLIVLLGVDYAGPGSDQLVVPEPAAQ